ncbi:MAG: hypothetical protein VKI83_11205 [Synechococcaceae cyanobacterium]|nr:hypothetical protein [Synechococcaceae cyanobacterium]
MALFPYANPGQHRAKPGHQRLPMCRTVEGDHQLEKLEFALAVARSRGDHSRCEMLWQAIEGLGGNLEEPGT